MFKSIYKRVIVIVLIALAVYSAIFSYLYSSYTLKETKSQMVEFIDKIDEYTHNLCLISIINCDKMAKVAQNICAK